MNITYTPRIKMDKAGKQTLPVIIAVDLLRRSITKKQLRNGMLRGKGSVRP